MKKIYSILGLCALFAMPTFAQEEEDVTHFIVNPGFDVDLTFNEDGTTKEIVETGSLSSRSHKHVAADGTIYARTKLGSEGNGNWKRNDTEYSMNGFLGQIKGWTLETGSNGEWTYFGAVPYSLEPTSTTVGIADDNNGSWLTVAGKPEEANTEDNKATMYLRAGWTNYAAYSQVVSLPCAQYRLEYWINNMNFAGTNPDGLENLCKITCRQDVFPDDEGVNADGWTKHTIEFTPTAEFTITMGFRSANRGSGTNPILLIDGLKLYKIGEADREQLLQADIMDMVEKINTFAQENLADCGGVIAEIEEKTIEFEDATAEGDLDAMEVIFKEAQAYLASLNDIVADINALNALNDKAATLIESEETYPGVNDLQKALETSIDTMADGTMADIKNQVSAMEKAIDDYYMSQEATPENPANFTFYIDNPTFEAQGKWYIGEGGGDQVIKTDKTDNDGNPINCWNAWRNNLEVGNSVSISQDLVGLRNGKYTLTADINTQNGCITDQHLFANATADNAVSPVMTQTGWDPCVWETLTTATVIVVDGKLTIGAIGHGDGELPSDHGGTDTDKRRGWFNLSNVRLNYLGEATAEEIAAVTAAKYTAAEELAESMHFAADKATYKQAIADAKAANDLEALNTATSVAEASENEYNGIIAGTYAALQDSIANSVNYSANAKKITQVPVDYMTNYLASAEATYTEAATITPVLRYYRDTLVPALLNAEKTEISDATGKAALQGTVAAVVADLAAYEPSTDELAKYVAKLNEGIQIAQIADINYSDGNDVTAYMKNPTVNDESGWTYYRPKGDKNTTTSQGVDGVSSNRYLDCWQAEAGTTRFTAYQIIDVPNGKYKISNIMRNSGKNVFLFASDKAPVKNEEGAETLDPTANVAFAEAITLPTNNAKYGIVAAEDAAEPLPEESIYNDSYGEIYCAAADRVIAAMNLTVVPGVTVYDTAIDKNDGETTCPAGVDPADWAIVGANGGKGRGWFNNSVEFEVTNHTLVVGISCDYQFLNKTEEEAFTGTWFSADNFVLTMVKAGDNTGWNPATGVESVESASANAGIYTLSGVRANGLQKGINIVKMANGSVQKVLVK